MRTISTTSSTRSKDKDATGYSGWMPVFVGVSGLILAVKCRGFRCREAVSQGFGGHV